MKNYPRIANTIYRTVWAITPSMHDSIRQQFENYVAGSKAELSDTEETQSPVAIAASPSLLVIPVFGILGKHLSIFETQCGGYDVDTLATQLKAAQADTNVKTVVLWFNSPGGVVTGVPEVAALIASVSAVKTVIAFTDDTMCSAAYWLASQCTAIYCTPSACVGSVGVYLALTDVSKSLENEGIKVNAITAGKYKTAGASFKPLTDDERALFQDDVDRIFAAFKGAVKSKRNIADENLNADTYDGEEATRNGYVDGIVNDVDQLLELVTSN